MMSASGIATRGARIARGVPGSGKQIVRSGRDRASVGVEPGRGPGQMRPERLDTR